MSAKVHPQVVRGLDDQALDDQFTRLPDELPRAFRLEGRREGTWTPLAEVADNRARLVRIPVGQTLDTIRFTLDSTWGAEETHLYAFYLD